MASRTIVVALVAVPVVAIVALAALALRPERTPAPRVNLAVPTRAIELPPAVVEAGYSGRLELDREGRYRLSLQTATERPQPWVTVRMLDHPMTEKPDRIEALGPGAWLASGTLSMEGRWRFLIGDGQRDVGVDVSWRR